MQVTLRPATATDADPCGRICYDAFTTINLQHGIAQDFPTPEVAIGFLSLLIGTPGYEVVVAEQDGRIIGSNAVDLRGAIAGVGPITVDPRVQNSGAGHVLMDHVMTAARRRGAAGVRLVQAAFHNRSLALYTKLGFDPREPLSCVQGAPLGLTMPGYTVRLLAEADVDACNALCRRVHGHDRDAEVRESIGNGAGRVVEHDGRIAGYTSGMAFFAHTVCETNTALQALIGAADHFIGPGLLVPTRNAELLRWCLQHDLRIVQPLTLMSIGLYNEPQGAYLPSISY